MLTLPNPCINQYQLLIERTCQQYTMRHMALLNQIYNSIFFNSEYSFKAQSSQSVIHTVMWFKTFKYLCTIFYLYV